MTDVAQPHRPSSQAGVRGSELLGSMENLEEVQAAVEMTRTSSQEIGRREKKLVQRARELLRTVQEYEPLTLKMAAQVGRDNLKDCQAACAVTQQQHSEGARAVEAACADVGLARPNRAVRKLMALAAANHRVALEAAAECAKRVNQAANDVAAGLAEGAEVLEAGRDCLDLAAELGVAQTLATIDRLLLRAETAAESGLLAGGITRARDAASLLTRLEADLQRLEKDLAHVEQAHARQLRLFTGAHEVYTTVSASLVANARASRRANRDHWAAASGGLLTWRRAQEEKLEAAAVAATHKDLQTHAKRVARYSKNLLQAKENARKDQLRAQAAVWTANENHPKRLGPCTCGRTHDCTACASRAYAASALPNGVVPMDGMRGQRSGKASSWPFNGPAGPSAKLGPGVYEPQKADAIVFPNVSQSRAPDLQKLAAPSMPFPAPRDAPDSKWLRTLRPSDSLNGQASTAPAGGGDTAAAPPTVPALRTPTPKKDGNASSRNGLSSASSSSSTSRGGAILSPGATAAHKRKADQREVAMRAFRQHLRRGGASLVSVTDFKALLRGAGLKNPTTKPWLHGAASDVTMATNFEADDYHRPAFICLGALGHLVTSPEFKLAPL